MATIDNKLSDKSEKKGSRRTFDLPKGALCNILDDCVLPELFRGEFGVAVGHGELRLVVVVEGEVGFLCLASLSTPPDGPLSDRTPISEWTWAIPHLDAKSNPRIHTHTHKP